MKSSEMNHERIRRLRDLCFRHIVVRRMFRPDTAGSSQSDRISAAIALWNLGDSSGVPVAIEFLELADQPYGNWEEPVWFLCRSHTSEGLDALERIVSNGPVKRAGEVLHMIVASVSGDHWGEERPPAGSVELCPVLISAMEREERTDYTINDVDQRIKDLAAKSLALMRQGVGDEFGGRFIRIDPEIFNETEPDTARRDAQIEKLLEWYESNKDRLEWDEHAQELVVKSN